jgi:hypothetical protein
VFLDDRIELINTLRPTFRIGVGFSPVGVHQHVCVDDEFFHGFESMLLSLAFSAANVSPKASLMKRVDHLEIMPPFVS